MAKTEASFGGVSQQVSEIFTEWKTWMDVSRNLSPNTIRLYSRVVEQAAKDLGDLTDQSTEALERWVQEKGGQPGTVANRISALVSFYRFLVKTKRVPANPALELDRPKQHKGVPKPVEDLEAVLKRLDEVDHKANVWGHSERRVGESRAMAVFLANTGLRIHEAVALNVPVPAPASITIVGKGRKEARVPLNGKARSALDFLGGRWPIGARATQRRFEKAGIHPHKLRHTFATDLIRKGIEIGTVSKLCRHSSPSTTMIYAAYYDEALTAAVDLL